MVWKALGSLALQRFWWAVHPLAGAYLGCVPRLTCSAVPVRRDHGVVAADPFPERRAGSGASGGSPSPLTWGGERGQVTAVTLWERGQGHTLSLRLAPQSNF